MPYVEVWVDDPEDCSNCKNYEALRQRRDLAIHRIFEGDINGAVDALALGVVPDGGVPLEPLRKIYETWRRGELEGFDGPAQKTQEGVTHDH